MSPEDAALSVLLVDDDPDLRLLWRLVLANAGGFGRIDDAADCRDALQRLETSCPDVVITDYVMPNGSGLTVIDVARRQRDDAIIVMTSNSYDVGDDALRLGASAFMNKYESTTERLPSLLRTLHRDMQATGCR